jgi:alkylhydroperoxidase family enzyme
MTPAPRPSSPRIGPLGDDGLGERERDVLAEVGIPDGTATNIFATLVRHPRLFRRWLPFGGVLLSGSIPARERELMILRTAVRCAAEYEWGQHVRIAAAAGVTEAEIARVLEGPEAPGWDPFDAALLRAVDELHDDSCISDRTWAALAARYDEQQLVELPMLVGQYHLVAFTLNSLGVQREAGVAGFPA